MGKGDISSNTTSVQLTEELDRAVTYYPSSWNNTICEERRFVKVKRKDLRRMQSTMLYSREHKLIMCSINKVASTEWRRFMVRINGYPDYIQFNPFIPDDPVIKTMQVL